MSEPALSLGFFDPAREVHGTLRAGVAVLFEGAQARTLEEQPAFSREGDVVRASCGSEVELEFHPFSPVAELGGASARVARVAGRAAGQDVECLGTVGETREPPAWAELDAVRLLSGVFDEQNALLIAARRPRGSMGHGHELVTAHLISAGELVSIEDARVSTVYDGQGRQRSVGLELWAPGEEFSRRGSGVVRAGLTLALEGLRVDAGLVAWRMDGRDGIGSYEITSRDESEEAA